MLRSACLLTFAVALAGGAGWGLGLFDGPPGPALRFAEPVKTVRLDMAGEDPVTVAFPFENAADRPVRLTGANVSCGCVLAEDLPRDVPPGASELTMTLDPRQFTAGKPRLVDAEIYSDGPGPSPRLRLTVEPYGEPRPFPLHPPPTPTSEADPMPRQLKSPAARRFGADLLALTLLLFGGLCVASPAFAGRGASTWVVPGNQSVTPSGPMSAPIPDEDTLCDGGSTCAEQSDGQCESQASSCKRNECQCDTETIVPTGGKTHKCQCITMDLGF